MADKEGLRTGLLRAIGQNDQPPAAALKGTDPTTMLMRMHLCMLRDCTE